MNNELYVHEVMDNRLAAKQETKGNKDLALYYIHMLKLMKGKDK